VEWARVKARKNRWEEEVLLLREEMRRLMRYLEWTVTTWEGLARLTSTRDDLEDATRAGLEAYAWQQADRHRRLSASYWKDLNLSLGDATESVVAVDGDDGDTEGLNVLFG
jgi:hypothetical protein